MQERIGFFHETSVKTHFICLRGWGPPRERLIMNTYFGCKGAQTLIVWLIIEALIAPLVIKSVKDGPAFALSV